MLLTIVLLALAACACTGDRGGGGRAGRACAAVAGPSSPGTIPQPPLAKLSKLTRGRLAPDSERVDLVMPSFSHPTEVAVDVYAQADDGSVWYLGEDVVDYERGVAAPTAGTWRVGLDGPAAMIMLAHPRVGDVYRTENIPASPSSRSPSNRSA
jgi:hypothetical protein